MITVQLDQFEQFFEKLSNDKTKCMLLFTSDEDQNGKYWCPDCEKIVVYYPELEKIAEKSDMKIYRCLAGVKQTWKDPYHIYRMNRQIKLPSIPKLGIFNGQKFTMSLNSDQIVQEKQRKLMQEFAVQQQ